MMYYTVRTTRGKETDDLELLRSLPMIGDEDCFIPVYERAYRKGGVSHLDFDMLLPGYILIRNKTPLEIREAQDMLDALWELVSQKKKKRLVIKAVSAEDDAFLEQILEDNIMKVSLLEMTEDGRIKSVVGPLLACTRDIREIDFENRAAVVEKSLFGRTIRLPFGIWSDEDPKTLWMEEQIEERNVVCSSDP